MTVLSAAQSALMRLIKRRPQTLFSSTDPTVMEVADLVNEVAVFIINKTDWQRLTKFGTVTGDGATTAFDLPSDFSRFPKGVDIIDPNSWFWNYTQINDLTLWMRLEVSGWNLITPGAWMKLNDQLNFLPAPGTGNSARFPYISKNYALSATQVPKAIFDQDSDSFVLDERLLTLGLCWMWKQQKRLDYSAEEMMFLEALSESIQEDQPAPILRGGGREGYRAIGGSVRTAWPWPLGQ